jgi:hypothetical protein
VCHGKHEPDSVLLCDTDGCDGECHMSCCNPPLTAVPDGLWFCSRCQSEEGFVTRIHVKKIPQQKQKKVIRQQRPAPAAVTAKTVTAKAVTASGVTAAVSVSATATVAASTVTVGSKNSRSKKRKSDTLPTTTTTNVSTTNTTLQKTANGSSSSSANTAVAAPIRLRISHNGGAATASSHNSKSIPDVRAHSARIRACNMNNNSSNGSNSSTRYTNRYGTATCIRADKSRMSHVIETGAQYTKKPKRAPVCDIDTSNGSSNSSSSSSANGNGYSNNYNSNGKCV